MSLQSLPESSRVWIFIANRKLNSGEQTELENQLQNFVAEWKAHGNELSAGFEMLANCIVVVAVDESFAAPSGCSIDKVFRLLTDFGQQNKIDFFQRTSIVTLEENEVNIYTKTEAENAYYNGELFRDHMVFNQQISDLKTYNSNRTIPFTESWLGRKLV